MYGSEQMPALNRGKVTGGPRILRMRWSRKFLLEEGHMIGEGSPRPEGTRGTTERGDTRPLHNERRGLKLPGHPARW